MRGLTFLTVFYISLSSCVQVNNQYEKIPAGTWRGILDVRNEKESMPSAANDDSPGTGDMAIENEELPFLFEVSYDDDKELIFTLHNGTEELVYDSIVFIPFPERERDSLVWYFPLFDTHIEALVENDVMEGYFIKDYLENYKIPFKAYFGKNFRFSSANEKPLTDLSDSWTATFTTDDGNTYPALGEFAQDSNYLTGTFRTNTGDYRFLEGTVQGDRFWLSTFDGTHAFLFEGKIIDEDHLIGTFRSGNTYRETWSATRGANDLNDPTQMTKATTSQPINFSFPNEKGEMVSLDDPQYEDKIIALQIMGTWCPNCMDESNFLKGYKSSHPEVNMEIIGLAFERYEDTEKSLATIAKYRNLMKIPYQILLAGTSTSKAKAKESLPFIDKIYSYPTLIVLDKSHTIVSIHTGFDGPATSAYSQFTEDFELMMNRLNEN